ncbi:ATP-grasp domain-containing protein [Streptomyces lydicus]|uniref:ATP-grasp domain-containing protein n=1 Tax=Streptomyces lydicus TaxID=47763 RepID=UPI00287089CA|nr:ATP-grasp domain-containing protein [Streptomyces lydicus]
MTGVLLLEADASAGEDLLTAAAGLGLDAYVATHEDLFGHYRPELTAKITAPVFTDFSRPETALADLTVFCRRTGIRGIVPCWEFLTPLATRLAAALGLPGHLPARADACRNKRLMAEAFAAHGVPSPRTLTAPDHATLSRRIAAAGLRFPLVVKPAENAASIGVSVVRSADGLPDAARLARSQTHKLPHGIALDTTLLAQEHVDGAEFSVETLVTDGTVHHLTVTEKFTTEGTSRAELGHTVPAELPPAVRDSVYAAATAALTALGLRNGIAHTELKVDPDGRPQVIEVGARPPGDHIMRLVKEALGIDVARACLETVLGRRPDLTPRRRAAAAIRFLTAPEAGTLRWISALPRGEHIIATSLSKMPGDEVGGPQDNMGRLGQIMLRADTATEANAAAVEALRGVTVDMTTRW